MICAYIMFKYGETHKLSVEDALDFYADRRTFNQKVCLFQHAITVLGCNNSFTKAICEVFFSLFT